MEVGQLFVTLGIKGADKATKELKSVGGTLGEVGTNALALKASIIGALYGLESLMSASMKVGSGLNQFGSYTDLSTTKLQQWQFAARQAGVSSEEMTGSIKNVQSAMAKMLLGEGAPKGMAQLIERTGFDPSRAQDTFYVMEKIVELSRKLPKGAIGNEYLKSFGLTEGVIAAAKMGKLTSEMFNRAPVYSERELKNLSKTSVAWQNLFSKFEMSMGRLTAREGLPLIKDISKASDALLKMIDSLLKLEKQVKVFQVIGKIFEGWGYIFEGISDVLDKLTKKGKYGEEEKAGFFGNQEIKDKSGKKVLLPSMFDVMKAMFMSALPSSLTGEVNTDAVIKENLLKANLKRLTTDPSKKFITETLQSPMYPNIPNSSSSTQQSIEVNQTLNFSSEEGTDPTRIKEAHKKAATVSYSQALRQIPQRVS